jgi:hypothetical protein
MASAYVEIPLSGQKAAGRVALVDIDDYELVRQYSWNILDKGRRLYVRTNVRVLPGYGGQKTLMMHRLVSNLPFVDHFNHNGLDNRRSNLRESNAVLNGGNRRRNQRGSSQYKGVSWYKPMDKWRAYANVNRRKVTIGYFDDEKEAAKAYDSVASQEYGEHACLNFTRVE